MKNKLAFATLLTGLTAFSQVGVGTTTPKTTLDVKGYVKLAGIDAVADVGTATDRTGAVRYNSTNKTLQYHDNAEWRTMVSANNEDLSSGGSVLAVDGKFVIAQEVSVLMATFQSISASNTTAFKIGGLTNEIIDNKNSFIGTTDSNVFIPEADGTYLITINVMANQSGTGRPVIGLWDDTINQWVARINPTVGSSVAIISLVTAIPLSASKSYSFRAAGNGGTLQIAAISTGGSGDGPVSFFSIKRVR